MCYNYNNMVWNIYIINKHTSLARPSVNVIANNIYCYAPIGKHFPLNNAVFKWKFSIDSKDEILFSALNHSDNFFFGNSIPCLLMLMLMKTVTAAVGLEQSIVWNAFRHYCCDNSRVFYTTLVIVVYSDWLYGWHLCNCNEKSTQNIDRIRDAIKTSTTTPKPLSCGTVSSQQILHVCTRIVTVFVCILHLLMGHDDAHTYIYVAQV